MIHRIVSVYFPDEKVIKNIEERLINNVSISSFIVKATVTQLEQLKGNDIEKDNH